MHLGDESVKGEVMFPLAQNKENTLLEHCVLLKTLVICFGIKDDKKY